MSDPHAYETIKRCPTCGISLLPTDCALWCRISACALTTQRQPTPEQVAKYKVNEPIQVQR